MSMGGFATFRPSGLSLEADGWAVNSDEFLSFMLSAWLNVNAIQGCDTD